MRITLDGETFELTPELVRARLEGHVPDDIREYWVEVDGRRWPVKQVISLATGGVSRRGFQSQSARRWLHNLGFTMGSGCGDASGTVRASREMDLPASAAIRFLRDEAKARTLNDVIASAKEELQSPGMYSWWVDEVGATDLGLGLGHPVAPGLLYAGLAGATRSGGASSSNTLWGRIATMHLGRRHDFSTLRRSLGSILAATHGESTIDEERLTRWMHDHLKVVLLPVGDPDALDALETEVLAELDPPLNLAKVPKNDLRRRLSALRRQYGR